jgi:hypothetical protein
VQIFVFQVRLFAFRLRLATRLMLNDETRMAGSEASLRWRQLVGGSLRRGDRLFALHVGPYVGLPASVSHEVQKLPSKSPSPITKCKSTRVAHQHRGASDG